MRTIGLLMLVLGLTSPASAEENQKFDRYVDAFWNEIVTPHFEAYRRCGIAHFKNLGKVDLRKFGVIEASVRKPCGEHMGSAREAMKSIGFNSKPEQIEVINNEYKSISQKFRFTYENQQHIELTARNAQLLQKRWSDCLTGYVKKAYKLGNREYETLIGSTFDYCKSYEKTIHDDMKTGVTPVLARFVDNKLFPALKEQNTQKIITTIKALK